MKRLGHILVVLSIMATVLGAPASVAADSRCEGQHGLQAWQDVGLNGVSFIRCVDVSDLKLVNDNIAIGDWNDRISSWQTFDTLSTRYTCLFENTGYGYTVANRNSRILGNNTLLDVGSTANDRASSLAFNMESWMCPTS